MKSHKIRASRNKVVTIHYTLTNDAGDVVDSSAGKGPLTYLHGHKNIVAGLESGLAGKSSGEKVKVIVPPDQGYGLRHEEAIISLPRTQEGLPPNMAVGDALGMRAKNGQHVRATIIELSDDQVKLDCNHPLAGTTLHFEVEIVSVRSATPEELKHGHAHGPSGCG